MQIIKLSSRNYNTNQLSSHLERTKSCKWLTIQLSRESEFTPLCFAVVNGTICFCQDKVRFPLQTFLKLILSRYVNRFSTVCIILDSIRQSFAISHLELCACISFLTTKAYQVVSVAENEKENARKLCFKKFRHTIQDKCFIFTENQDKNERLNRFHKYLG